MSTSNKHQLIGIAGTALTGKDTLAERMAHDYGYTHVSTGDMVRAIAQKEEGSIERLVLHKVATRYREGHGAGVFVRMALEHDRPLVVTGLRSKGEGDAFKASGGQLLFIDAPIEIRYQRMLDRHRDAEVNLTLEEFQASEASEWYEGPKDTDFNLEYIKTIADDVVQNTSNELEHFLQDMLIRLGLVDR